MSAEKNETLQIITVDEMPTFCQERERELDDGMRTALRQLGIYPGLEPPRTVATNMINRYTRETGDRALQLFANFWGAIPFRGQIGPAQSTENVLTPGEVLDYVTEVLYGLYASGRFEEGEELLRRFPPTGPIGYISHMDELSGGHGWASVRVLRACAEVNQLALAGPYAEIGAGPGKITNELIQAKFVPEGSSVTLIEPNTTWSDYSQKLLGPRLKDRLQIVKQGGEIIRLQEPLGIVTSALCLQWITGEGVLESVIRNVKDNLEVGGRWLDVGENPKDVFGTTLPAVRVGLDIGFEGAYDWVEMAQLFERAGFIPDAKVAVTRLGTSRFSPSRPDFLETLSPGERNIVTLAQAMNEHDVIGASWQRVF